MVLYEAGAWRVNSSDEQHLLVFEREILRTIYGPIFKEEQWRIRHNHELLQLYKHPEWSRAKRLAEHVQRMEPNLPAKKVLSSNPEVSVSFRITSSTQYNII